MLNITKFDKNHLAPSFIKINLLMKNYDMYMGEWCISPEENIIFLCITKCASTSITKFLGEINYNITIDSKSEEDIIKYKNVQFYSIIRNPELRYISGLNQFIQRHSQENHLDLMEKNLDEEKFIFDEHTLCQHYFLEDVMKYHNINLIQFDENLNEKLSDVFGVKVSLPKLNTSKNNHIKFCEKMYNKYCATNKNYLSLYKKDFELYNISV